METRFAVACFAFKLEQIVGCATNRSKQHGNSLILSFNEYIAEKEKNSNIYNAFVVTRKIARVVKICSAHYPAYRTLCW